MISALADFVYLGDEKTAVDEIDEHLSIATALIGQMEMPESRLRFAPGLRAIFNVFLNMEKLSLIKKDSFFILMSRAVVVDFDVLYSLTEEGKFSAAASEV